MTPEKGLPLPERSVLEQKFERFVDNEFRAMQTDLDEKNKIAEKKRKRRIFGIKYGPNKSYNPKHMKPIWDLNRQWNHFSGALEYDNFFREQILEIIEKTYDENNFESVSKIGEISQSVSELIAQKLEATGEDQKELLQHLNSIAMNMVSYLGMLFHGDEVRKGIKATHSAKSSNEALIASLLAQKKATENN